MTYPLKRNLRAVRAALRTPNATTTRSIARSPHAACAGAAVDPFRLDSHLLPGRSALTYLAISHRLGSHAAVLRRGTNPLQSESQRSRRCSGNPRRHGGVGLPHVPSNSPSSAHGLPYAPSPDDLGMPRGNTRRHYAAFRCVNSWKSIDRAIEVPFGHARAIRKHGGGGQIGGREADRIHS